MHEDIRVMPPGPELNPKRPKRATLNSAMFKRPVSSHSITSANKLKSSPSGHVTAPSTFKTPEQVAATDSSTATSVEADLTPQLDVTKINHQPQVFHHIQPKTKKKLWPPTKKQLIIGGSILALLLIIGGGWFLASHGHQVSDKVTTNHKITKPKTIAPKPNTVPSTLSGLPVPPADNNLPITAVMIENTPYARPQSGLSQAGVVFEALTEGGITRFMALFQDQQPTSVGPVRSARPYFLQWDLGFDAPYAHMGGSPEALADIKAWGVKDLDGMYYPGPYTRISSRQPPHNLYTSIPQLVSLEASQGWTSSNFSGWPRKADSPSKTPDATNINFDLSYSTYNVSYSYNASTNSYNRFEDGAPQTDANTNKQLSPKVVIGMVVPWSNGQLDSTGAYYSVYQTIGTGTAYVFQDGTETTGQWSKASANAPLQFTTATGQPLKLNAGQTWITALASANEMAYN